jgi:hypothetical protein
MEFPELPQKFTWKAVKLFLQQQAQFILTIRGLQGKDILLSERQGEGTTYDVNLGEDGNSGSAFGKITVTDGTTTLVNITKLHFDGTLLKVTSGGAGIANVVPQTESCP